MRTTDLFKNNRSARKLNESMEKIFGQKIDLASFDLPKLEDARNKLRTQLSQARAESGFNENLENEAYSKAQFMLDAINAEIIEREEFIADPQQAEISMEEDGAEFDVDELFNQWVNSEYAPYDDDSGDWRTLFDKALMFVGDMVDDEYAEAAAEQLVAKWEGEEYDNEPSDSYDGSDDADALASAGFGSDEDYGYYGHDESIATEGVDADDVVELSQQLQKGEISYDEFLEKLERLEYTDHSMRQGEMGIHGDDTMAGHRSWDRDRAEWDQYDRDQEDEYDDEYDDERDESVAMEKAPPGGKYERMVKHIKKGYAKDGKLSNKEKSIAYATAWKQKKKDTNESVTTGEDMTRRLTEGEIQQASAIVNAKTMVDRVGRWIEELSGMENDTLLQLGDSIRDEMSADLAKQFISQVAPAIQQALETLKGSRETLASGVRLLTGEEQGAEMLGAEPGVGPEGDLGGAAGAEPGGDIFGGEAEPDALNAGDEFAAAEPAAGGLEDAGRMKRESIERQNNLLKVLAG